MKTGKVIGIVVLVLCIPLLVWAMHLVLYPVDQATKVYEKTLDADNAVYNYEYFKQAYEDIRAMDVKIVTAQTAVDDFTKSAGPRDKWDFRDKEEAARLNTNLTGLRNVRNDLVATYNARSKMANRSIFQGKDTPDTIEQ